MGTDAPSFDVLGVRIDAVDPSIVLDAVERWIRSGEAGYVCVANVHAVMEARRDQTLQRIYDGAKLTVPDGMPLVWLGRLFGHGDVRRVYGPDFTLQLCQSAARHGYRCFFYGGAPGVADALAAEMSRRFPGLRVAGTGAPPFRPATAEEAEEDVGRINRADPDIVFVGLGCPKQERWMAAHRDRLAARVLVGVGAAFDFHTGRVRQAPRWMMRAGLEWLFRLAKEPRRLWYRYLVYNPLFLFHVALQLLGLSRASQRPGAAAQSLPWRQWRTRVLWSVVDQALVSGSQFLLNILIARWVTPAEYGLFAVAYAGFVIASGLHSSLLVEPMSVLGAARPPGELPGYLSRLVGGHVVLTLPIAGILVAASLFVPGPPATAVILAGLGTAVPCVLLQWLLRQACYVEARSDLAARGSAVYAAVLLGGAVATGALFPAAAARLAFPLMAAAALLESIALAGPLGLGRPGIRWMQRSEIAAHWAYGRWILTAGAAHNVANLLYLPLLWAVLGLQASAVLRALQNLVLPLQQALSALTLLALPWLSRRAASRGGRPGGDARRFVLASLAVAVAYSLALVAGGGRLLGLLYGPGVYASYEWCVPLLALGAVAAAASQSLGIVTRARGQPDAILWSKLAAAASMLLLGMRLVSRLGVVGALLGLAASSGAEVVVLALCLRRR